MIVQNVDSMSRDTATTASGIGNRCWRTGNDMMGVAASVIDGKVSVESILIVSK